MTGARNQSDAEARKLSLVVKLCSKHPTCKAAAGVLGSQGDHKKVSSLCTFPASVFELSFAGACTLARAGVDVCVCVCLCGCGVCVYVYDYTLSDRPIPNFESLNTQNGSFP